MVSHCVENQLRSMKEICCSTYSTAGEHRETLEDFGSDSDFLNRTLRSFANDLPSSLGALQEWKQSASEGRPFLGENIYQLCF